MYTFEEQLEQHGEYGVATQIRYPMVRVDGLPNVQIDELVIFEDGTLGQVIDLQRDHVNILLFQPVSRVTGIKVARVGTSPKILINSSLLGQKISPINFSFSDKDSYHIAQEVPPITMRSRISRQLITGTSIVDTLLPIGLGQRELIVGDRKTGKTTFLLNTAKQHIKNGGIVVYAAIGKRNQDIAHIENHLMNTNRKKYVIVASGNTDSPGTIYMTPYTAMTIAEILRLQYNDILLILDDLTTHAKFYREISLLSGRFPGRDSYPGDIFFKHAHLLERAGSYYMDDNQSSSITCLPVAESVGNDLTNYIVSNLVSITDGHLLFDNDLFSDGRRPPINTFLSVTRVGKQTLSPLQREINEKVTSFLAEHNIKKQFSHFGSELTNEIRYMLAKGQAFYTLFNQTYVESIPISISIIVVGLIWSDSLSDLPQEDISSVVKRLTRIHGKDKKTREYLDSVANAGNFKILLQKLKTNDKTIKQLCKI